MSVEIRPFRPDDVEKLHKISGTYNCFDYPSMFRALAIASSGELTTTRNSCLTSSELRIVEMLILGQCTDEMFYSYRGNQ